MQQAEHPFVRCCSVTSHTCSALKQVNMTSQIVWGGNQVGRASISNSVPLGHSSQGIQRAVLFPGLYLGSIAPFQVDFSSELLVVW